MLEQEFKTTRQGMLNKTLSTLDDGNISIMKSIESVDPKYAKHMFLRNELLQKFAMSIGGGINILEQPVCTHCERPAAWDIGRSAYCFSCNKTVPVDKVITIMDYLIEYTKAFTEEQLEILNQLGGSGNGIIE